MAFELFTNKSARSGGEARVSVSKRGSLSLNRACMSQHFEKVELVQLLYDAQGRRIAIKPASAGDEHTYKVCRAKQGGGHVSGQGFLKFYNIPHDKTRSCPAKWDLGMGAVVVELKKK
jgi:hypothetical protein